MFKHILKILVLLSSLCLTSPLSASAGNEWQLPALVSMPELKYDSIQFNKDIGLYEVVVGENILYVTANGKYIIVGEVINPNTKADITEARRKTLKSNQISNPSRLSSTDLDFRDAIKYKSGSNSNKWIAIFDDPDCPYCKQQHMELQKIDGLNIYIFMYPIISLHPQAYNKAISVLCNKNLISSLDRIFITGKYEENLCSSGIRTVDKTMKYGERIGIKGTPTIFLSTGEKIEGYIDSATLKRKVGL